MFSSCAHPPVAHSVFLSLWEMECYIWVSMCSRITKASVNNLERASSYSSVIQSCNGSFIFWRCPCFAQAMRILCNGGSPCISKLFRKSPSSLTQRLEIWASSLMCTRRNKTLKIATNFHASFTVNMWI